MAKNYKNFSYFDSRPDVVQIFEDLEAFHDFCRLKLHPFNEADLYNKASWVWRDYLKSLKSSSEQQPKRPHQFNKRSKKSRS